MIHDMLITPHIPSSLVPLLMTHYSKLHPGDEELVPLTAEIIADVREPISILETSITQEEQRKKDLKVSQISGSTVVCFNLGKLQRLQNRAARIFCC